MQMLDSKGKEDGEMAPPFVKDGGSAPDIPSDMDFSGKDDDFGKPGQDDVDFEDVPF
jgi:hypothetical protein